MDWNSAEIHSLIQRALEEDVGAGDITSRILFDPSQNATAIFLAKQEGVIAGLPLVYRIFQHLQPDCAIEEIIVDSQFVSSGSNLCRIKASLLNLLSGERVALNFLQRLSGIATQTAYYAKVAAPHGIQVLDTRKTTPLLRRLEKYAVRTGGGKNHRAGLYDAVLVKDNHLKREPDFRALLQKFKQRGYDAENVEIEVTDFQMLERAIEAGGRWFLLDNMSPSMIRRCIKVKKQGMHFEVSGGVTRENFTRYLIPGVDSISIGALTHTVRSLDISMEIID